ncbi:hypothetical protein Syun_020623 [Stephania yunnanensis]|uniref:Uncharacterized protein n=1 Tax=Stephania yunnanensis TaxID=152371 RepID=A0AAP0IE88_9MAGN
MQAPADGGESTAAPTAVASQQPSDGSEARQLGDFDGGGDQPADSDHGSRSSGGRPLSVRQWLSGANDGQETGQLRTHGRTSGAGSARQGATARGFADRRRSSGAGATERCRLVGFSISTKSRRRDREPQTRSRGKTS